MPTPLNQRLYDKLQRLFGHVKISDEGQSRIVRSFIDDGGKQQRLIVQRGENYAVNCPVCHDTRYRLHISHMFGVRDENNRVDTGGVVCYNENCFTEDMRRYNLVEDLQQVDGVVLYSAAVRPGIKLDPNREATLPGTIVPLHQLPPEHPANEYLIGRFFDPAQLSRQYGVGYCVDSDRYWTVRNRIIVPIYQAKKLKGWQARFVGEINKNDPDPPPKWFSDPSMQRNQLLYSFGEARKYRTGVVVEGPSSKWGFGPMAVGTLGSSMSKQQVDLLKIGFVDYPLIMLWDPDVRKDPNKVKHIENVVKPWLKEANFNKGFTFVWLPEGSDPADWDRDYLWRYVEREALANGGIKVDWRLR